MSVSATLNPKGDMDEDRKWHLAWAQLDAFSKNLPSNVREADVEEFHRYLDLLHDVTGEDISPFRIPQDDVRPHVMSMSRAAFGRPARKTMYSKDRYCDRNLMVRKLDAVYNYFKSIQPPPESPEPPRFGF